MKNVAAKKIFIASLIILSPLQASALPFNIGEKLEFQLSWAGLPAGTLTMEVKERTKIHGREAIHITSKSWSNDFISTFYKLDVSIDDFMDAENLSTLKCEIKQKKKNRNRSKLLIYDYEKKQVKFTKKNETKIYDVPSHIYDTLSSIYYLRTQELVSGKSIRINTFSNGKFYTVDIRILNKEKIKTDAGTFDTIKVYPLIKGDDLLKGKGEMFIWLTDDEYKIPVKIKTKIKFGHIKAELTKLKRGDSYGD